MDAFRFQIRTAKSWDGSRRPSGSLYFFLVEGPRWILAGEVAGGPAREPDRSRLSPRGWLGALTRIVVFNALVQLPLDLAAGRRLAGRIRAASQASGVRLAYPGPRDSRPRVDDAAAIALSRASSVAQRHARGPGASASDPPAIHRLFSLADTRPTSGVHSPSPASVQQIGPYAVRGTIRWQDDQKILLGEDSTLERPVWIVVRAPRASGQSQARRALNRRSRPRWIGGGDERDARWDAFTAPSGFPLTELVKAGGLPWSEVLPLLRELAEELEISHDEGTLPTQLSPEQVWIQPDGSVQLIDFLDSPPAVAEPGGSAREPRVNGGPAGRRHGHDPDESGGAAGPCLSG